MALNYVVAVNGNFTAGRLSALLKYLIVNLTFMFFILRSIGHIGLISGDGRHGGLGELSAPRCWEVFLGLDQPRALSAIRCLRQGHHRRHQQLRG